MTQPPLGGCVLKRKLLNALKEKMAQPPLGGCVLKQAQQTSLSPVYEPAAFRRLCVETKRDC